MLSDQSMHSERKFMQAGHASIPARAARGSGGGGRGLKRKLEVRPKRHALIFGGIPSFLVILIDPKRQPFSPAFGFGFGTAGVSAQELCSVVLIDW